MNIKRWFRRLLFRLLPPQMQIVCLSDIGQAQTSMQKTPDIRDPLGMSMPVIADSLVLTEKVKETE